ncbi:sigma 54-interacting transcriptional regulator [Alkaliphilus transvaalensis]|uniref:sigma 54-interacting transcriptional regulator n=1 Tax=Alkaliphilus transvaalensis TaxID=114628 RepID=UPI000479935B|nr:sigma 54-interacting transcriptional regulator [Alkaliphilus transvaalensis]
MKEILRLEIVTEDRMGITFQVLEKLYLEKINLISVEVFPGKINMKIENILEERRNSLITMLFKIKGVAAINEIELLNFEKDKRKLYTIIDSVDDGIMAINKNGKVEMINTSGEKIFGFNKEDLKDRNIFDFISEKNGMMELISRGEGFTNLELSVCDGDEINHYLATGRPIKNDDYKTIGMVISFSNFQKAVEIANIVSNTMEGAFSEIIGNSLQIEKIKKIVKTVSKNPSTVLLRGESGTGKDLFAKAIHNLSERKDNKFVPVNCAALPPSLIESELFGYNKGSFTGAITNGKEGLFHEANGGTLFLDEIAELPLVLQAKLLRVIQEGVVRRIGSSKEENVDVRIIVATNRNLEDMIRAGTFREDLYYRLNVIPIFLPPLRERLEDIPLLLKHICDKLNRRFGKNITGADTGFINALMDYQWPGNVRELQNVIERAMILCNGDILTTKELYFDTNNGQIKLDAVDINRNTNLKEIVEDYEKDIIIKEISKHKSLRKAALALGISHTTLINKVRKHQINWQ